MKAVLYCAGLGDVIRVIYQTQSYQFISETTSPVPVIVASHNPFAMEIFRFHRNARNFVLFDLAHKYEEFLAGGLRGGEINRALCEFAGIDPNHLVFGRAPDPPPVFDAPDGVESTGHIVFQPFAGNGSYRSLPQGLIEATLEALRRLPHPVYLITRSYIRRERGGKIVHTVEDARRFEGGNVRVCENLSVPACLNLVKGCRAYVGSWSSLHQAAWFENKPVAVFYPKDYRDVTQRTGYAFGMDRENTLGREFPAVDGNELERFLMRW